MDTTYHAQPLWTAAKQTVAASRYEADSAGLLREPIGGRGTGSTSGSVTQRTRLWQGCPDAEDAERLNGARTQLRKHVPPPEGAANSQARIWYVVKLRVNVSRALKLK